MQRILLSLGMIVFVGAAAAGATGAFFSDTETSTGNVFTAGALDLKVDSEAHYNGSICQVDEEDFDQDQNVEEMLWLGGEGYPVGLPCTGTWAESDLIPNSLAHRFFNFDDVKPGDEGENTISLHVYDNDAWGCFIVDNVVDSDVTCNEPESEGASADPSCNPNGNVAEGELGAALTFDAWLDQGTIAGFQCNDPEGDQDNQGAACVDDPAEGNNIQDDTPLEALFWNDETVDEASEGPFAMSEVLAAAYLAGSCTDTDGNTDYGVCHGLAADGRMVGSATYYWGLAWNVPAEAGNEIQTDQLTMDMIFEVAQHRNNPNFQCTTPELRTTLTLAKTVLPAETAPDSAFTLTATGPDTISGIEGSNDVFFAPVTPGSYDLSESGGPGGQTSVTWECNVAMEDLDTVTIPEGSNVVCTVTNDYRQI